MTVFADIENIFQTVRDYSESTRSLVTIATGLGGLVATIFFVKATLRIVQLLRLYFFSQYFSKTDYRKKYGQWALITGSTDGIGLGIARQLARRGHSIILVGRNPEKLASTKVQIEAEPNVGEVMSVLIDLADSSLENYQRVKAIIDPDNLDIGILVNNAGIGFLEMKRFHRFDDQSLSDIMNVNCHAAAHFTRMVLPGMLNRGRGLVVNVSSMAGKFSLPYLQLYPATKAFLDSFTESLIADYRGYPIDFMCLNPGGVKTKLADLFDTTAITRKPNKLIVSVESFSESVVNLLSSGSRSNCGCFSHECQTMFNRTLTQRMREFLFATAVQWAVSTNQLTPKAQRRNMKLVTISGDIARDQRKVLDKSAKLN